MAAMRALLWSMQKIFVLSKSGRFFLMRILILTLTLITCWPRYHLVSLCRIVSDRHEAAASLGRTDGQKRRNGECPERWNYLQSSQIQAFGLSDSQLLFVGLHCPCHYYQRTIVSSEVSAYILILIVMCWKGKVALLYFDHVFSFLFYVFCHSNTSDIKHTLFSDVRRLQNMRQGNLGRLRLTYRQRSTRDFGRSSLSRMENWTLHFVGPGTVSTYLSRLWYECAGK